MKRTSRIITTICILALAASARAAELHVPSEYATIKAAIDAAYDGDTVIVADGTYTGEGNRDIDFLGKTITVKSESGPENCIIDCNGAEWPDNHRGFKFHSGEDRDSILNGFTITNAYGWDDSFQGAILCSGSSPIIEDCIIVGNKLGLGGGISCHDSNPTIINCIISNNSVHYGGGAIYCNNSNPIINNCIFEANNAGW